MDRLSAEAFKVQEDSIAENRKQLSIIANRCENWRTESICRGFIAVIDTLQLGIMHYRESKR
jgi:hypothetical protein